MENPEITYLKIKKLKECNKQLRMKNMLLKSKVIRLEDYIGGLIVNYLRLQESNSLRKVSRITLKEKGKTIEEILKRLNEFKAAKTKYGDLLNFIVSNFEAVIRHK